MTFPAVRLEPELLPRRLDRYDLLEVLGRGSFATVYRARHVHTHQAVAIKVLSAPPGIPFDVERWLIEARATAAVDHPNVVRVLDCEKSATGEAFIVMELASGSSLDALLESGTLTIADAIQFSLDVLDGLEAAHRRGIIHRDVKPPNIIVTTDDAGVRRAKLIDFGVSKVLTALVTNAKATLPGTAIGTPGYMAPELFGDAANADARADIYAVGAMLYRFLGGRLPFIGPTYEDFVVQVRTERPPPLASIAPQTPPLVAAIVDRALARDRDARWPTARELADALRRATQGRTPDPAPLSATTDARFAMPHALPESGVRTKGAAPSSRPPAPSTVSKPLRVWPWAVGVLVLFLLGASISVGAGLMLKVLDPQARDPRPSKSPAIVDPDVERVTAERSWTNVTETSTPPVPTASTSIPTAVVSASVAHPKVATTTSPTSTVTRTSTPTASGSTNGARFHIGETIGGQIASGTLDRFVAAALPRIAACRGTTAASVDISFIVHTNEGTLAGGAHGQPRGTDATVCVEQAIQATFDAGARILGGSIIQGRVDLDPK